MKQGTVVRHLAEMAEAASTQLPRRDEPPGRPLRSLWAAGAVLGSGEEDTEVVLGLDVPADELPWLALHPAGEWVGESLRLGKRPLLWTLPIRLRTGVERPAPPAGALLDRRRRRR